MAQTFNNPDGTAINTSGLMVPSTVTGGNKGVGTINATQIYQNGTALAAVQLSDYAVGTWTPSILFGNSTAGITYTRQAGNYYKVGKIVTAQCFLTTSNKGTATGSIFIGGLPFVAANNVDNTASAFLYLNNAAAITGAPFGLIVENGTSIVLQQSNGTAATSLTNSNANNNTSYLTTITYNAV